MPRYPPPRERSTIVQSPLSTPAGTEHCRRDETLAADQAGDTAAQGPKSAREDTIAAIATPTGQAGIGIIRLSGPESIAVAGRIFAPRRPRTTFESHRLYLGRIVDPETGDPLDEVLLSIMKSPHSYTGEDVVEINSHSGHLLLLSILKLVFRQGARPARPGEFTLRAFLNGRIDLTQAEAVAELIRSRSETGLKAAARQIQGVFKSEIEEIRRVILRLLASVEVAIDFPEEARGEISMPEMIGTLRTRVLPALEARIETHDRRRWWVDGVRTAIVGRTNVGKSSILNRLLEEDRAIVTPHAGTTRDVIEAAVTLEGLPFLLMDTAGLRQIRHEVEQLGIRRTEEKMADADFLLIVLDQSRSLHAEEQALLKRLQDRKILVVFNKSDLPSRLDTREVRRCIGPWSGVRISALTGEGMAELRKAMVNAILTEPARGGGADAVIPNLRHRQALQEAGDRLQEAARALEQGLPPEVVAAELQNGLDALGGITGETVQEDVLEEIFSSFCLGK